MQSAKYRKFKCVNKCVLQHYKCVPWGNQKFHIYFTPTGTLGPNTGNTFGIGTGPLNGLSAQLCTRLSKYDKYFILYLQYQVKAWVFHDGI